MRKLVKAAALAGLLVGTGAQAADLSNPLSLGDYKGESFHSWRDAGEVFVRLRGEAAPPDVRSAGSVTNLKASNEAIPELDFSHFLTGNIAVEPICCPTRREIASGGAKVASTTVFPPTLLVQYHLDMGQIEKP